MALTQFCLLAELQIRIIRKIYGENFPDSVMLSSNLTDRLLSVRQTFRFKTD